jgi:predicted Zn-dependent protease
LYNVVDGEEYNKAYGAMENKIGDADLEDLDEIMEATGFIESQIKEAFAQAGYQNASIDDGTLTYWKDGKKEETELEDEDVKTNSEVETITAMIRVFDGKMWYTSQTADIENIQATIDNLATLAKPNPQILKNPIVKNLDDC